MQIAIVPASPRTGQAAIRALLADPSTPTVVGVYRDPSKAPEDLFSYANFKAVRGDVDDAQSLDFTGADAVINITPPIYDERDALKHAKLASENVKAAARKADVRRLVLVSSVGAQYDHGTGEILTNHAAEKVLQDSSPEVIIVRCAYFMENWASALETITLDQPCFYSTITPLDYKVPMVAIQDIGEATARDALEVGSQLPSRPHIYELQGPQSYSPLDVQHAFEGAVGKKVEIKPVPKEALEEFFSNVFPPSVVPLWVEMSSCFLPGGLLAGDMERLAGAALRGKVDILEVAQKLCATAQSTPA